MKQQKRINITTIYIVLILIVIIISGFSFYSVNHVTKSFRQLREDTTNYNDCRDAFTEMKEASAFLTDQSRYYITRGDRSHLELYLEEVRTTKRREHALSVIEEQLGQDDLYFTMKKATEESDALAQKELYAMLLYSHAKNINVSDLHLEEFGVSLSAADLELSPEEQEEKAKDLLYNEEYFSIKDSIEENVYLGGETILKEMEEKTASSSRYTEKLLRWENLLTVLLIFMGVAIVVITIIFLILPIYRNIRTIRKNGMMEEKGVAELAYLAQAYNTLHEERTSNISKLSYEASHDSLTGIYNRKVFEEMTEAGFEDNSALMIVDVDHFKTINDENGHDMGDVVLKRVASCLSSAFRSNDFVFRIGGDEFAVILINMKPEYQNVVLNKMAQVRKELTDMTDIPKVTLSVGVAFAEEGSTGAALFKQADTALYESKNGGRNRTTVYSGTEEC